MLYDDGEPVGGATDLLTLLESGPRRRLLPRLDRLLRLRVRAPPRAADERARCRAFPTPPSASTRRAILWEDGHLREWRRRRARWPTASSPSRSRTPACRRSTSSATTRSTPSSPASKTCRNASAPAGSTRSTCRTASTSTPARSTRWPSTRRCGGRTRARSSASSREAAAQARATRATVAGPSSPAARSACSTTSTASSPRGPSPGRGRAERTPRRTTRSRRTCAPTARSRPSTSCSSTCCATTSPG